MKTIYKILTIFVMVLILGNLTYLFTWTGDMLKGYWIGSFVGVITGFMIAWLMGWK